MAAKQPKRATVWRCQYKADAEERRRRIIAELKPLVYRGRVA